MKSQIHLIRHGITEGNQRKLYYGASDIPLADEGVAELKKLVKAGIYPRIDEGDFYTTGLQRTEQTLAILYGEREHEVICQLQEMRFGEFEMKSYEELKAVPAYVDWISDNSGQSASPGGESISEFSQRIRRGFEILIGKHRLKELSVRHSGKEAISAIVCHGGSISSMMEACFPGQKEHFFKWIPDPGHGYTLNLEKSDIVSFDKF